jgi:UTP--glucose-1-phosphate uridylyltransferase
MPKITKAVFPVAGMGTRFLPATKASPKEMMPVVDKPLIQYAVEEAIAAGVTEMIFITGRNKRAIEDHFDKAYEMETELEARGKSDTLEMLRGILPKKISCIYIRQSEALGLGHAVLCARPAVGNEPFAVLLADDLLQGPEPIMRQLCHVYEQNGCSILAVQNVQPEDTTNYGIVKCGPGMNGLHPMIGIVEKPRPENAPSTLGVVGRYILTPKIFEHLAQVQPGAGGEIQLTDGIASLLQEERALAYEFAGIRYDCGTKIGYLKAMVELGLEHPEVGREFAQYLSARGYCLPVTDGAE